MPASLRDDVSLPFAVLGVVVAGGLAAGYLFYPDLFSIDRAMALAYGSLLVAFALAYSYRPLRESRYGSLASATFLMLFAGFAYQQGLRGPIVPFGLFLLAFAGFAYELYRIRGERERRGQVS